LINSLQKGAISSSFASNDIVYPVKLTSIFPQVAPYKKVLRSEIVYDGIELTEFPQTFIYKFELLEGGFEQSQQNSDGGKYYDQSITLKFNKITVFDNINFQRLLKKDYFLVLEDRNGNFFLMGFRNGATCGKRYNSNFCVFTAKIHNKR